MRNIAMVMMVIVFVPLVHGYRSRSAVPRGVVKTASSSCDLPVYTPAARQNAVLFVEDWSGNFGTTTHPDSNWNGVLNTLIPGEFGWYQTTAQGQDGPDLAIMQTYHTVIWNTYDDWWTNNTLTINDMNNVADYISGGGKVWLIGQDILYSGVPYAWMQMNFHLKTAVEDYIYDEATVAIQGLAEIGGYLFTATCDYDSNGFYCDNLEPDTQAHEVVIDETYGGYPAIAAPNSATLSTSFWTVDGRSPSSQADWEGMVMAMLLAFGYTGVEEGTASVRPLLFGFLPQTPALAKGSAAISYVVTEPGRVALDVYDRSGRQVERLTDGYQIAGIRTIGFNADRVPEGVYFLRLAAGDRTSHRKLIVIR